MDSSITLSYGSRITSTMVSNNFIDRYMTDARGSDVKVYIYLLRCLQSPQAPVSIESIAEALDETEKDIRTALRYWDKLHVLSVKCHRDGTIKNITLHDLDEEDDDDETPISDSREAANITTLPYVSRKKTEEPEPAQIVKPNYSSQMIQSFKKDYPDFDDLIDYIENAMGKTLSQRDLQTPSFIFEGLGFPTDLICFLYDYCIEKDKRSNAYIEKIAREWHSKGICTVTDAMTEINEFNNRYAAVKNAFGITRSFGEAELVYIKRWYHEFRFPDEVIALACDKALLNTSKPKFQYADKILTDWNGRGIKTLEAAQADSMERRSSILKASSAKTSGRNTLGVSMQYSQRSYTDSEISAIEKKKLGIL